MDVVKTKDGFVSGTVLGEAGKEVHIYRGIPYAAPPVGDLRWQPPQPVVPWAGIRECTVFSKQPTQFNPGMVEADPLPQSEDCLYLNVLTSAKKANDKLPVMVWMHGGGFSMGHGNRPIDNSIRLTQQGIVLVTINARLGVMGLMAHPLLSRESSHGSSGNYLFLDLIAALKWVRQNIAAFGGDPDKVTIFGQSGGGGKVIGLIASPLAKGLFHRAIVQSGGLLHGTPLKELEAIGEKLFAKIGVKTLKEARALDWERFAEASDTLGKAMNKRMGLFDSAVDGWFLPDTLANVFKAGKQNAVTSIMGANLGELTFPLRHGFTLSQLIPDYVHMLSGMNRANTRGYAYIFDQVPGKWKQEGATSVHSMELSFVFGAWDLKSEFEFLLMNAASSGAKSLYPEPTEADIKLSKTMMSIWTHFARTGDPNVKGLVTWPAWEASTDQYLYLVEPLQVKSGFSKVAQEKT
jgi:para-nitrobenzyl esterase